MFFKKITHSHCPVSHANAYKGKSISTHIRSETEHGNRLRIDKKLNK